MTSIRTSCDVCGDVELDPDDLFLIPARGLRLRAHYAFLHCGGVQIKPMNGRVSTVLASLGVAELEVR